MVLGQKLLGFRKRRSLAAGARHCPAAHCRQKQNEQAAFLIRGSPTLLARSQEEPTYLIELTSEIAGGSRLFRLPVLVELAASELPDPAIPEPARTSDNSFRQHEMRVCDNNAGRL